MNGNITTIRQKKYLKLLATYYLTMGIPPTYRDARAAGIWASSAPVSYNLHKLADMGIVTRRGDGSRSTTLNGTATVVPSNLLAGNTSIIGTEYVIVFGDPDETLREYFEEMGKTVHFLIRSDGLYRFESSSFSKSTLVDAIGRVAMYDAFGENVFPSVVTDDTKMIICAVARGLPVYSKKHMEWLANANKQT